MSYECTYTNLGYELRVYVHLNAIDVPLASLQISLELDIKLCSYDFNSQFQV